MRALPESDDDAAWDWIHERARETYRHHITQTRGQQICRADDERAHLIWAAIEWYEARARTSTTA